MLNSFSDQQRSDNKTKYSIPICMMMLLYTESCKMAWIGITAVVSFGLSEKLKKSYAYSNHLIENYKKTLYVLHKNVNKTEPHLN